jgi:hypothetical protein
MHSRHIGSEGLEHGVAHPGFGRDEGKDVQHGEPPNGELLPSARLFRKRVPAHRSDRLRYERLTS